MSCSGERFARQYQESTQLLVERSTAGPIGSTHLATVASLSGETTAVRWFFFDEYSERAAIEFGRLMASDEHYKQAYDNREVEWAIVADIYGDFARQIMGIFADVGVFPAGVIKPSTCPVAEAQRRICEPVYRRIKSLTRSRTPFSQWDCDTLYYDSIERAQTAAREFSTRQ